MRIFYGWVVVGAAFAIVGLAYPSWHIFSIFYVAMLGEFGWSRAETAAAFSLFTISYAVCSVIVGRIVVRYGSRRVIIGGALVLAVAVAATSLVREQWHLYVLYGVATPIGLAAAGSLPNQTSVQTWFVRHRGTALGFAGAGAGASTMFVAPIAQLVISGAGWRVAYLGLGALALLILPLAMLHRSSPAEMGLRPDGERAPARPPAGDPPRGLEHPGRGAREWTVGRALRTARYWLLFSWYVLGMFSLQLLLVHQVAALTDAGYARLVAASVVGLVGGLGSAAKICWGSLSDRIGREWTMTLGGAVLIGAELLLLAMPPGAQVEVLYFYVVLAGIGYGVFAPLLPAVAADLYHGRHYPAILGTLNLAHGVGSAGGPWLAGLLFDLTGRYTLPLGLGIVAMLSSCTLFWLAGPRHVRRAAAIASPAQSSGR